jgi:hypothetical protein
MQPNDYGTGMTVGDDQGWNVGYDPDINRWTEVGKNLAPRQDMNGDDERHRFGSAHPFAMNMVFADGTIRKIGYDIDPITHARLGNRSDGQTLNWTDAQ